MTATTDEFVQLTRRSQEAVTHAARSWTETVQDYAGSISPTHPLPAKDDTLAVVDSWFDLAARVLTEQRTLTTAVVTRSHDALSRFTEQAGAFTATVAEKIVPADQPRAARNGATRIA